MVLKPFYTYAEVAALEGRPVGTIKQWVSKDKRLPSTERRFPGAFGGEIPLADLRARYEMTNDELRALDPPPVADEHEGATA